MEDKMQKKGKDKVKAGSVEERGRARMTRGRGKERRSRREKRTTMKGQERKKDRMARGR